MVGGLLVLACIFAALLCVHELRRFIRAAGNHTRQRKGSALPSLGGLPVAGFSPANEKRKREKYLCGYVCLLALIVPADSQLKDGAALYRRTLRLPVTMRPAERVPSLQTIKAMSPEAVYMTLTSGVMKSRAEGMPIAQIFALIGYIALTGTTHVDAPPFMVSTCKSNAPFVIDAKSPQWNGWSPTLTNSRLPERRLCRPQSR